MYEVAICDDVPLDIQILKKDIMQFKEYDGMLRFHEFTSGGQLLNAMEQIRFSIIFLDIRMKNLDGNQTAKQIRNIDDSVVLVYCTGYEEPSLHSIEMQAYRFIKKSMPKELRKSYIRASLDKMAEIAQMPTIVAKVDGKKIVLKADDIVFVEKYKKTVRVHISEVALKRYHLSAQEGNHLELRVSDKLINLYEMLKPCGFGYPHDSYIINFKYVISCADNDIKLEGFPTVHFKVTRSKAVEFNELKRKFLTSKYWRQ